MCFGWVGLTTSPFSRSAPTLKAHIIDRELSRWKMRMNRAIAIGTDVRLQRKPKVRRNLKRLLHIRNMQDTKHAEIRNYSHCGFTSFQTKCNVSTLPCGSYEPDKHMLSDINIISRSRNIHLHSLTPHLHTLYMLTLNHGLEASIGLGV